MNARKVNDTTVQRQCNENHEEPFLHARAKSQRIAALHLLLRCHQRQTLVCQHCKLTSRVALVLGKGLALDSTHHLRVANSMSEKERLRKAAENKISYQLDTQRKSIHILMTRNSPRHPISCNSRSCGFQCTRKCSQGTVPGGMQLNTPRRVQAHREKPRPPVGTEPTFRT